MIPMAITAETGWRVVYGVLFVAFRWVRWHYRERWKETHAKPVERRMDTREKALLALTRVGTFLPTLLWLFTPLLDFANLPLPPFVRGGGAALTLLGTALFAWVHRVLGDNWSPTLEIRRGHELVMRGPYRLVRHPMYTAILVQVLGFGLVSANLVVLLLAPAPFWILLTLRLRTEERMMLDRFGEAYRVYMRSTKRLVPWVL